jgi:hypothetical protein
MTRQTLKDLDLSVNMEELEQENAVRALDIWKDYS